MKNNLIPDHLSKQSLVCTIALVCCVVPTLHLPQAMAVIEQTNTSNIEAVKVTVPLSRPNEAKRHLMTKLSKLAFFSANFTQQILSEQGDLLQNGSGTLAISKPNLVNWTTTTPDETLIVSDGETLWFYDPFIEQASAYSLAKSIHNTPILLLTSDEDTLWQKYDVVEKDLSFVVTPKDDNSQIKQLTLSFSQSVRENVDAASIEEAQLTQFSFKDATGQVSKISLTLFNSKVKPAASLFKFTLPQGVRLEDKR